MKRTGFFIWITCFLFILNHSYAQIIDTVCAGDIQSIYAVDSNQGSTYSWNVNGGDIISGNGTHRILVNWKKQPGLFRLSVSERNANGCIGDNQIAYVLVRGTQFKTTFPDYGCMNDSVTIKASGGLWYNWSSGQQDSTITIKIISDTSLNVVISDTVCGLKYDTLPVFIKVSSKPTIAITSDANEVFKNQPISLYYLGDANDRIKWNINKSALHTRSNHGINITFSDTGEALVQVVSVNLLGCVDSAYKKFEIREEHAFFPTAFSPNSDGLNDYFAPGGMGIQSYQLQIFNRWGQLVFFTNDKMGWDGTLNGEKALSDVYIYQCDIVGPSGRKYGYNGNVTLIR